MDKSPESEFEAKILDKIEEIKKEIEILREHTTPQALDNAIGRVSRMDFINNRSINEAQIRKNEAKLKGLNNWLGKLGTPEFGKCLRCGNEININRLLFMPESNHCVHCAK